MLKPSILIDFDKTISPIHGFSEPPISEAVSAIDILKDTYKIVIYSCRANPEICSQADLILMIDYLKIHNIHYDEIMYGKPLFVAIIDDRSFNPTKHCSWDDIIRDLMSTSI